MSSSFSWRTATHRKPYQSPTEPILPSDAVEPAVDPAPNPRPISQLLAFGVIIVLALLQFLPATHFRDASDPFRKWVPFNSSLSNGYNPLTNETSGHTSAHAEDDRMVHIVSWMDCLDLRMLAVLANSTLSNSRHPELVYFHFFTPEGLDEKVSYYKLKVLFPHSNLELLGQKDVTEAISTAYSRGEYAAPSMDEIAPFAIPIVHPSLSKFMYVSPNVIMKGRVDDLVGVNLSNYAIAIAEDCSKRLSNYVNSDILDAIQRSASKPWVSKTSYSKNACMPELGLLLIDATKLEKDLVEAILWWSRVLNTNKRVIPNPAIALALWDRHVKLPSSWKLTSFKLLEQNKDKLVLRYGEDGNVCTAFSSGTISRSDFEDIWNTYLPPTSDRILGS